MLSVVSIRYLWIVVVVNCFSILPTCTSAVTLLFWNSTKKTPLSRVWIRPATFYILCWSQTSMIALHAQYVPSSSNRLLFFHWTCEQTELLILVIWAGLCSEISNLQTCWSPSDELRLPSCSSRLDSLVARPSIYPSFEFECLLVLSISAFASREGETFFLYTKDVFRTVSWLTYFLRQEIWDPNAQPKLSCTSSLYDVTRFKWSRMACMWGLSQWSN